MAVGFEAKDSSHLQQIHLRLKAQVAGLPPERTLLFHIDYLLESPLLVSGNMNISNP